MELYDADPQLFFDKRDPSARDLLLPPFSLPKHILWTNTAIMSMGNDKEELIGSTVISMIGCVALVPGLDCE